MKKSVKLVPTMVLAMVAAVGCGEKPEPAGPAYSASDRRRSAH